MGLTQCILVCISLIMTASVSFAVGYHEGYAVALEDSIQIVYETLKEVEDGSTGSEG